MANVTRRLAPWLIVRRVDPRRFRGIPGARAAIKRGGGRLAEIWFVSEGPEPTRGGPAAEIPVQACVSKLKMKPTDFRCGLDAPPRFGDQKATAVSTGARFVVVQVLEKEAKVTGWKPGFYVLAGLHPRDAARRLAA